MSDACTAPVGCTRGSDPRKSHGSQRCWGERVCGESQSPWSSVRGSFLTKQFVSSTANLLSLVWLGEHGFGNNFSSIHSVCVNVNEFIAVSEPTLSLKRVNIRENDKMAPH